MKILIADDESLARSTLRSILQEIPLPLIVLEDATNGEEMVELVKRYLPQLVFVDIKMPRLNGLEAIKAARAFAPEARWFILTGFSEFSYAQEAVRMGVSDYLLKPVDPPVLTKVVMEVLAEHNRRLAQLNKQFEREIGSLFHGLSSIEQEDSSSLLLNMHFIGGLLLFDGFLSEAEKAERQRAFLQHVQAGVDAVLPGGLKIALFVLPGGEAALIGAWQTALNGQGEQLCVHYLDKIAQSLQDYCENDFCITMLQTSNCHSYAELFEQIHWLQRFASLRVLEGIGRRLHFKELFLYKTEPHQLERSQLAGKLGFYYQEKMYVQYMHTIDELVRLCSDGMTMHYGIRKGMAEFFSCALPCQLAPEQEIEEWKRQLQACGEQMLLTGPKKDHGDILTQVLLFTERNYQRDIGLAQIAEKLRVTPNYLSTLFHKRTGMTFMKYVTKLRMLKARELLSDPGIQVQQVAEQVGYYSVRHFTKVFTAFFGHYPSEQRKKES